MTIRHLGVLGGEAGVSLVYFKWDRSTTFVFTRMLRVWLGIYTRRRRKTLVACGYHVFRVTNKRTTVKKNFLVFSSPLPGSRKSFLDLNDCYYDFACIISKTCLFLICKLWTLRQDSRLFSLKNFWKSRFPWFSSKEIYVAYRKQNSSKGSNLQPCKIVFFFSSNVIHSGCLWYLIVCFRV